MIFPPYQPQPQSPVGSRTCAGQQLPILIDGFLFGRRNGRRIGSIDVLDGGWGGLEVGEESGPQEGSAASRTSVPLPAPDSVTYGAALSACVRAKSWDDAAVLAERIRGLCTGADESSVALGLAPAPTRQPLVLTPRGERAMEELEEHLRGSSAAGAGIGAGD